MLIRLILVVCSVVMNSFPALSEGFSSEQTISSQYLVPTNGAVVVDNVIIQSDVSKIIDDSFISYVGTFATFDPQSGTWVEFNPYIGKGFAEGEYLFDTSVFLITDGSEVISLASVVQVERPYQMGNVTVTPIFRWMPQLPVASKPGHYLTFGSEVQWNPTEQVSVSIDPTVAYDNGVYGLKSGLSGHFTASITYQVSDQLSVSIEPAWRRSTEEETNQSISMRIKTNF